MSRPLCKKQDGYQTIITTRLQDGNAQTISVQTIQNLKQSLVTILQTAQQQEITINSIWMQRQLQYEAEIQNLQSINSQLQQRYQQALARVNQVEAEKVRMMRQITQYQSKQQLMSNRLAKFQKVVEEKEAVIKYLQQKQETYTRKSTNLSSRNSESSFNDINNLSSIPLLNLQNLSRPKTFEECSTNRNAPSTQRLSMLNQKRLETPFAKLDCTSLKSSFIKYESQLSLRGLREKKQAAIGNKIELLNRYNKGCDYNVWKFMNKQNKFSNQNIQSSIRNGVAFSSGILTK